MDRESLKRVLRLHHVAYELLLWVNKQAVRNPARLSSEQVARLRDSAECANWLREIRGQVPPDVRVDSTELEALSHLFVSFFVTSFERTLVKKSYDGPLVPQLTPIRGRLKSHGRRARKKNETEALALMRIALRDLAEEIGLDPSASAVDAVMRDDAREEELILWSYAHELVRRSNFASQGPAVHYMWTHIDPTVRRELTDASIWRCRDVLIHALKAAAVEGSR